MAIDLSRKRSAFNFFESFSDLVFCALVMFLVLVLFLAVRVGQRAEAVEDSARQVADRRVELSGLEAELADGRGRLEERQSELDMLQQQLTEARAMLTNQRAAANRRADELAGLQSEIQAEAERLRRIAGADRFVSVREAPRLTVAFVWPDPAAPPSVQPIPASLLAEFRRTADLAPDRRQAVFAELRAKFLSLSQEIEPLSPAQYRALVAAVSEAQPPGLGRVRLEESFRPDLSMVVTGAVAPDFSPRWADPQREAALRTRLRTGEAYRLLWPDGRPAPERVSPDRPTLRFDVSASPDAPIDVAPGRVAVGGGAALSEAQFRRVLEAIGGGQLTVAYQPGGTSEQETPALPRAFAERVLEPAGYVVRAPDPEALRTGSQLDTVASDPGLETQPEPEPEPELEPERARATQPSGGHTP
ncbi:MAG: hypothetical protein AAF288_07245 [Planctomycetota bacterium]